MSIAGFRQCSCTCNPEANQVSGKWLMYGTEGKSSRWDESRYDMLWQSDNISEWYAVTQRALLTYQMLGFKVKRSIDGSPAWYSVFPYQKNSRFTTRRDTESGESRGRQSGRKGLQAEAGRFAWTHLRLTHLSDDVARVFASPRGIKLIGRHCLCAVLNLPRFWLRCNYACSNDELCIDSCSSIIRLDI